MTPGCCNRFLQHSSPQENGPTQRVGVIVGFAVGGGFFPTDGLAVAVAVRVAVAVAVEVAVGAAVEVAVAVAVAVAVGVAVTVGVTVGVGVQFTPLRSQLHWFAVWNGP